MPNKNKQGDMIGLEVHVYPITNEKLFCRCKASREKGQKVNVNVCPICTGQPGAKPELPNKQAVEKSVAVALILGCKINNKMAWQRKHYNWPDLPKGYQNTLSGPYATPVGEKGKFLGIRIREMHLEEDPASWDPKTGCIDYNRSGLPLLEIVTEPDFETSEEVMDWLNRLALNLRYLKAADNNAGIKCDVNVSVNGGERVEVKNVSSIEDIGAVIDYELGRQQVEKAVQETRRYNARSGKTERMRGKEDAEDYRFISDPDLQEIVVDSKFIERIKKGLPESPDIKLKKLVKKHKVGEKDAKVLAANIDLVEFFEGVVGKSKKLKAKDVLHWITGELLRVLNYNKKALHEIDIKAEHFGELVEAVIAGRITELQGKKVLNDFVPKSFSIKKAKISGKISNDEEIEILIDDVLKANGHVVQDFLKGKKESLNYLIGQVMKKSERRADFKIVRGILEKKLKTN